MLNSYIDRRRRAAGPARERTGGAGSVAARPPRRAVWAAAPALALAAAVAAVPAASAQATEVTLGSGGLLGADLAVTPGMADPPASSGLLGVELVATPGVGDAGSSEGLLGVELVVPPAPGEAGSSEGLLGVELVVPVAPGDPGSSEGLLGVEAVVPAEYAVRFDSQGGSAVPGATALAGERVPRPADPTKAACDFAGWYEDAACTKPFDFDSPLTGEPREVVLFAKWDASDVRYAVVLDPGLGSWDAVPEGWEAGEGAAIATEVPKDAPAREPAPPKRAGWQFAGWHAAGQAAPDWDETGASKVPLGEAWDFSDPVTSSALEGGALVLHARWELRLDVSLPVEVGFAVDAGSCEVTTPDAGLYAVRSRTARTVQVEEVAVLSPQGELDAFFSLAEEPEGGEDARKGAWRAALQGTELWVWRTGAGGVEGGADFSKRPDGAGGASFALPLADEGGSQGEHVRVEPDGTEATISGWRNAIALAGNPSFTLAAFDHASGGPSVSLPLKLGMGISGALEVEANLDGPKPVTHLVVTVSATP